MQSSPECSCVCHERESVLGLPFLKTMFLKIGLSFLLLFPLLFPSSQSLAQENLDAGYFFEPRILAIDQPLSAAKRFNDSIARQALGYDLILVDHETPGVVKQIFKTQDNETLRLEFQYRRRSSEEMPRVFLQKINGNPWVIATIYNYLFRTNIDPGSLTAVATPGKDVFFQDQVYEFILESDDYAPGYWNMIFIR